MSASTTNESTTADVAVVGAGPAGRWLARLLAGRDVDLALIDPRLDRDWPNNYGVWLDEVDEIAGELHFDRRWSTAAVRLDDRMVLDRTYGRLDNEATRRHFDAALADAGATRLATRVEGVDTTGRAPVLRTGDGRRIRARLVVDASGADPVLVEPPVTEEAAFQRAFGLVGRFETDPLEGDEMVLMDYRPVPGDEDLESPTFLYGMHLGGDRYFVEETILVGPSKVAFSRLRSRLTARLAARGAAPIAELDRECCHIPMATTPPRPSGGIAVFGAAAGLVHPATGYQMGRMLRAGPPVADAIADGLAAGDDPASLSRRVDRALWPRRWRRTHRLLSFGRRVLATMDDRRTKKFFRTFFSLSDPDWRAYLRGDVSPTRVAGVMWRLFVDADLGLRARLAGLAVGDGARAFRDAATAPGPILEAVTRLRSGRS